MRLPWTQARETNSPCNFRQLGSVEPGREAANPVGHQRRKRDAVDCTAAQAVAAALLASSGERTKAAMAERQKFSALLKMLRAGLT
jgi:hypothetical protein